MFAYPLVKITCDECRAATLDWTIETQRVPFGAPPLVVFVPEDAGGWRITAVRQLCPACDFQLEQD